MRAIVALGLLLSAVGVADAAATTAAPDEPFVPMTVRNVGALGGQNVVLLEGGEPRVILPIWIGSIEAGAIDLRIRKEKPPRPLTHDLLESTLAALGARVERVEVVDLRDNVFFGRLTVRDAAGKLHELDARPSDCTALAAGAGLPIYVATQVLDRAAVDAVTLQPRARPTP